MGRITRAISPSDNVTVIHYDTMGRVTARTNPGGETTTFSYDDRGDVSGVMLPDGSAVAYDRNDLGQIKTITDPNGNAWSRDFDAHGRPTSTIDPLGNATTFEFDNRNRVSRIDFPDGNVDVIYDAISNINEIRGSDGTNINYTHDELNRFTAADGITVSYANNQLTETNGITFTRDGNGRIATMMLAPGKTVTYMYNNRNLLTKVTDWLDGVTNFVYDDAGLLVTITRPNGGDHDQYPRHGRSDHQD